MPPSRPVQPPVPHEAQAQADRLSALAAYGIAGTEPEPAFDALAQMAADACSTPMAAISFVDDTHQWFKAAVGLPFRQTSKALSFCTHALTGSPEPMVVTNALEHPVFMHNPMVVGAPHIRFYACVALITDAGFALGTIAVMDTIPRHLTPVQMQALEGLAARTLMQLELRQQQRLLAALQQERDDMRYALLAQVDGLKVVSRIARIGGWVVEVPSMRFTGSKELAEAYGVTWPVKTAEEALAFYAPRCRNAMRQAFLDCAQQATAFDLEAQVHLPGGASYWVRTVGQAVRGDDGRVFRIQGALQDITAQRAADQERQITQDRFDLVVRATADVIWDWDIKTDTVWWNDSMHTQFGIPVDSLPPGCASWSDRLHPDESAEVQQSIHAATEGADNYWSAEYRFRRQNGQYAWVLDRGFVIRDGRGRAVRMVGGMTDITAHKKADIEAQSDAQNHAELLRLQQTISSLDMPLAEVLQRVAQTALRQTAAQGVVVELLEDQQLLAQASVGRLVRQRGSALPVAHSILWKDLLKGQTVLCNDTVAARWDMVSMPHRHGVLSVMATPLRAGDAVIGAIKVASDQVNAFSRRDVAHLEILTESLGSLLQLRNVASQLHVSEHQYRTLFDEHPQPMWVYDRKSLRLLAVNKAMVCHYGYSEAELLQMCMHELWPVSERDAVKARIEAINPQAQNRPIVRTHLRKDGSTMDVEITAGNIIFDGQTARQVLAIDITERLRNERELARMGRAQRLRSACNEALVRATSESGLLQTICQIAVDIGGYRMGWVGFAMDNEAKSIDPIAQAGYDQYNLDSLLLSWSADHPHGRGPAGTVIRTGQPVIIQDIRHEGDFAGRTRHMLEHGFHGVICLPLHDQERTFGLLYLYAPEVLHLSEDEATLLQELANDLAFGLTRMRARKAQQQLQTSVLKVAAAVSASTGTEFFIQLVRNMAEALGAQGGCVVRLLPHAEGEIPTVFTLAAVLDGEILANADYSLAGTPSLLLLNQRQLVVPDKVLEHFPNAPILPQVGARGYAGQQLCNSDGEIIGMLFVVFRQPLENADFIMSTLQIFAARASGEIDRQLADTRIRHQASLLDKAQDAIVVRDMDHRIIFWNKSAERLYGWSQLQVLGQSVNTLLYPDVTDFERATRATVEQGEWTGELTQQHRDGSTIAVEGRWTLVRSDDGQPQSILAINTDIRQRKATELEIQRLAFYDPLTGLPNRLLLMDRMHQALATAQRRQQGGALLFIDLDNFKTLNDTLGHDQGDLLLQQVAQRLSQSVRNMDTVARLGGDEFVVMLEELSMQPDVLALHARAVGEKILATLAMPYALAGHQYRSTPSIGVAPFLGEQSSVKELLKQADLAMYQAKTAGRNTLRFFDPEMQAVVSARAALETDLRSAVVNGEFLLHYQPQVQQSGRVVGVEALLRWVHPRRGMVSPAEFIPVAEETGLILTMGSWVLQEACLLLASWRHNPELCHMTMAVNVSSRQFRSPTFVQEVAQVLASTGAPSKLLKLELTESLLVENMEATIATMLELRAYGVGFSLDDFGTGYSSLSYLKRMPLDQIKIDQSFVRDLLTDPNDAAIVETIIGLSRNLGLEVIAEGVETSEQRALLARAGCMLHQGYLFSRPLSEAVLGTFLSEPAA